MRILLPLLTLFVFSACDTHSREKTVTLNGFDYSHKKITELQPELNEISGIAYDRNKHCFLAINDEQGILFALNPSDFTIQQQLKFGKKGDYECVATNGTTVFVLKSNGDVYAMNFADSLSQITVSSYPGPTTEFESCIWDDEKKVLKLVSKKSAADKEIQANNIYNFNPEHGAYVVDNTSRISWDHLKKAGLSSKAFHPSGAATEPSTGNIYVVASIEKSLVIFKSDWTVLSVHQLDEAVFPQPEGITFDKDGNLLITNEAAGAKPTLVFIPVKK